MSDSPTPDLPRLRERLTSALVCDALDSLGYPNQSPRLPLPPVTLPDAVLIGRCKTTLWADMAHPDPDPYALELQAVDSCEPNDVLIAATGGSRRSAIWGELLTTASRNAGCVGAIIDGGVRDIARMKAMAFPVFAGSISPYDSLNRQRVIDVDVRVEIDRVPFAPGDYVVADIDGIVVVPAVVAPEAFDRAWRKATTEDQIRDAIRGGVKATEAYRRFGTL